MRARDARAITFCTVSTLALLGAALLLTRSLVVALALTAAYAALALTRPRMIRVFRRLRGDPDWSGYFDNEGTSTRLQVRRGPGPAASPSRPAARR